MAQEVDQRLFEGLTRTHGHLEHVRDCLEHALRGAYRSQLAEPRAGAVAGAVPRPPPATPNGSCPPRPRPSMSPTRVASSAATTRSTSRPRPMNDVTCRGRFPGNASSDSEGRELPPHPRSTDLEHALRLRQVTQTVLAEIQQRDALAQTIADERGSCLRTHELGHHAQSTSIAPRGSRTCRSSRRRESPPDPYGSPLEPARAPPMPSPPTPTRPARPRRRRSRRDQSRTPRETRPRWS